MEYKRVKQDHLARSHNDILRRVDPSLRGRALGRQVIEIGTFGVWNKAKPMRSGHYAQTAVFHGGSS